MISLSSFDVIQEEKECWTWKKPPPESKKASEAGTVRMKRKVDLAAERQKVLKGIMCRHAQIF